MKVQCTKKLLDQLRVKPAEPVEEEPVFSWHANLITINRRKAVVLINDSNRYAIVLYGLKAKDFQNLDKLIVDAIRETFLEENIDPTVTESFLHASPMITYTRTSDRSHVAKMNQRCKEFHFFAELLDQKELLQPAISRRISRSLVGDGKNGYINPNEELYKDLEAFSGKAVFHCQAVQIKVTLKLENKKVWRRLIVPLNVSFSTLHEVLQIAFGWQDYHLHEFYILNAEPDQRNPYAYYQNAVVNLVCNDEALDYMNEVPMVLETGIKLSEYIPAYKNTQYNYDFGDDWNHVIKVEKVIEDYDKNYPVCMEGEGNAPPEDVGGEPGYEQFLRVIADQDHPDHQHLLEWGTSQGYQDFTLEKVNWRLGKL